MQKKITDTSYNKYIALAGALFLLLVVFFNSPQVNKNSDRNFFKYEMICETQNISNVSALFMEDTDEEDIDKYFLEYCKYITCNIQPVFSETHFPEIEIPVYSTLKNNFRSDLSPPL